MPPVALTSSVDDHHWLVPFLLHLRTDHARDDVVAATGREADDDADGFCGIALSASTARRAQQRDYPHHGTCVFHTASPRAIRCDPMTAHRVGLPGPETGRCQHHYRWGTIFHGRAFTKNADRKGAAGFLFPSPKKREVTLISLGFAAFVSLHFYSMSSHLDTKRNSLTSLSPCGTILQSSAPQTQKKEKDLSPDVSVRRQAKKGRQLAGSRFSRRTGLVGRLGLPRASPWRRTPRPSPFCIRSRSPAPARPAPSLSLPDTSDRTQAGSPALRRRRCIRPPCVCGERATK